MIAPLLLGTALLMLPKIDQTRQRLNWLAANRPGFVPVRPTNSGGARWWQRLPVQWRATIIAVAAGLPTGWSAGPVPGCLAGICGAALGWCWWSHRRERDVDRDQAALATAVGVLAEEYSAGATLGSAFRSSAPTAGRFAAALTQAGVLASYGAAPERALAADPALAPIAVACGLVGRTGASLIDLLAGIRSDLAADRATRRAVAAAVAGPRTSAILLATLPVVGMMMGMAMGVDPARVLLRTPVGLTALSVGVLLDLVGLAWTLRLTRRSA